MRTPKMKKIGRTAVAIGRGNDEAKSRVVRIDADMFDFLTDFAKATNRSKTHALRQLIQTGARIEGFTPPG